VAAGNFFSSQASSTLPWECLVVRHSSGGSNFSPTAPGFTNTRGFTNVATTGAVFGGPTSPIEVLCHNDNATVTAYDPVADLTATRVSGVNGTVRKPAHPRIMNHFPKVPPARSSAVRTAPKKASTH
jgi:hypothetical protein